MSYLFIFGNACSLTRTAGVILNTVDRAHWTTLTPELLRACFYCEYHPLPFSLKAIVSALRCDNKVLTNSTQKILHIGLQLHYYGILWGELHRIVGQRAIETEAL